MSRWLVPLAVLGALGGCARRPLPIERPVTVPQSSEPVSSLPAPPAQPVDPPAPDPTPAPEPPPVAPPRPARVRLVIRSNVKKAFVQWGKKKLGRTPVIFSRPRDSGPLDLVVRAEGHFPVHTRVYTMRSESLTVRLTPLEQRMSLLGAKAEPPPTEVAEPTVTPPVAGTPTVPPPGPDGLPTMFSLDPAPPTPAAPAVDPRPAAPTL